MSQKLGLALVGIGALALVGWSVSGFFAAADIPLVVRISMGVIGVGVVVLIASVIRDRMSAAKTEDFKGVKN